MGDASQGMDSNRVIKLKRSDDDDGFVLLHVAPRNSRPLDLDLTCTDGQGRYVAKLRQNKIASLRIKNCPASETEWESILQSLLNHDPQPDIQAMATVQDESSVSITIRKQIQGITQRLGSISLDYNMDEIIQLWDWCGDSAEAARRSKEAAQTSTVSAQILENEVKDLKAQLDELVQLKERDETALLQKFRDLLNEKKAKIREQQKIIAASPHNGDGHFPVVASRQQASPQPPQRSAGKSRSTKRKSPPSEKQSNQDDGDEQMDVDIKSEPEETEDDHTTDATASVGSDDDDEAAPPTPAAIRNFRQASPPQKSSDKPPPVRSLPFGNKKSSKPPAKSASVGVDSETESDDEL